MSRRHAARLAESHLLALNAASDDTSRVITVAILHVSGVAHVNLLRRITNQFDGVACGARYLATVTAFAQQRVNRLDLVPALKRNKRNFEQLLENWSGSTYLARLRQLEGMLLIAWILFHLKILYGFRELPKSSPNSHVLLESPKTRMSH